MDENDARIFKYFTFTAFFSCAITVLSGILVTFPYINLEYLVRSFGITLQHLRPIHETFATAWIFLGTVTVVYYYLYSKFKTLPRLGKFHLALWLISGLGIFLSLIKGSFSGREYLGFHPVFSILILIGWLIFAYNYFSCEGFSLKEKPVYVYMWTTAIILFAITFIEGHIYLLDYIGNRPVKDIAIQWKSYGSLVAAFNLLVYGSLMFVSEKISGNTEYARSNAAFALFFIGALNSFTNYGHHTYHLPQTPWIHWVSFIVSMLEIIILFKTFTDLLKLFRKRGASTGFTIPVFLFSCSTVWTFLLLILALLISVPPINTFIHGTHVVVAHSMGSMLGIDSTALWACFAFLLHVFLRDDHPILKSRSVSKAVIFINVFLFIFWASFVVYGSLVGWTLYLGSSAADYSRFMSAFPYVMSFSGTLMGLGILCLLTQWVRAMLKQT